MPSKIKQSRDLTKFDRFWQNLLPNSVKKIMPHWGITAVGLSLAAILSYSELLVTMTTLFWASLFFAFCFRWLNNLSPYIEKQKWIIPLYHGILFAFVAKPVMAQGTFGAAACQTSGLFATVGSYTETVFSAVSFGAIGGATLSTLICQVIGFLTLAIILGFLGVLGYVAFQIGYQRQPVSTTLDPLFGFLIFAGGATMMIAVMLGTTV